jgi:hypothetical protein
MDKINMILDDVKRHLKNAFKGAWIDDMGIKCTQCMNNLSPRVWLSLVVLALILGLFL